MNNNEKSMTDRIRMLLSEKFPLYRPEHLVFVVQYPESTHITYRESIKGFVTSMNLQALGKKGYILTFIINEQHIGKGYGTMLYRDVAIPIFRELGCERILTTPSGMGTEFWPKRGFTPVADSEFGELERLL